MMLIGDLALWAALGAVLAWGIVLVRFAWWHRHRRLRRDSELAMPIVGILAAIGSLASAIGYNVQLGRLPMLPLPFELLTLTASIGRGALIVGALLVLVTIVPPRRDR